MIYPPFEHLYEVKSTLVSTIDVVADEKGTINARRHGDILLYITSKKDYTGLNLVIGGQVWETFDVKQGIPYAFLNNTPIPMICLQYHDVKITGLKESDRLQLGYINLTSESKRNLSMNSWWFPSSDGNHHYLIAIGMGTKVEGYKPYSPEKFKYFGDAYFEVLIK
jgi:hypothetical protein